MFCPIPYIPQKVNLLNDSYNIHLIASMLLQNDFEIAYKFHLPLGNQ